jgi:serine/threonine-protein kinase
MPSTTFEKWVGRQIGANDRYRLEAFLGSGGMGTVFLARDVQLGKTFAVKLLRENFKDDDECQKRFAREADICLALSSPHIARIEDYGVTEDGHPYFVMEYLKGETLGQRLSRTRIIPSATSVNITKQICLGLKTAHTGVSLWRQGQPTNPFKIIHRDLKPENIFLVPSELTESGELVKILDFGIAKIYGDTAHTKLTQTNIFMGSFQFASPEQIRSTADVDERTDIYSLGMIFYQMLSGTDPFGLTRDGTKVNNTAWLTAHTIDSPLPLRSQPQCTHLDPSLEPIVQRCLAKNPDERFQSVEELLIELKQLQTSAEQPVPSIAPAARLEREHKSLSEEQPAPEASETKLSSNSIADIVEIQPVQPPTLQKRLSPLKWVAGGLGAMALLSGGSYGLLLRYQTSLLDELNNLRSLSQFEQCIGKAQAFPEFLPAHAESQVVLNQCRLEHGKQLALDNQFAKAIAVVRPIPKQDRNFAEARDLMNDWADELAPKPGKTINPCHYPNSPLCSR